MDFKDQFINDKVEAILSSKEVWSREEAFMNALFALMGQLHLRGYSRETMHKVFGYVEATRENMLEAYHQELVKGLHVEGDTEEEAKKRKWVILT